MGHVAEYIMSQQPGRNDPCPCGSGRKYKHCCAKSQAQYQPISQQAIRQLEVLFHAKRFPELESQARRLVAQYPDAGMVWKILGTALGMQGKDAQPALSTAARLMPHDPDVHINLGNVYKKTGQYESAVSSYQRALAIQPRDADAHNNLGIALKARGQYDAAIAAYLQAIEINPNLAEAYFNLGNLLHELGKLRDAVANFNQALAVRPNYLRACRGLGKSLHDLGEYDAALNIYRQALSFDARYGDVYVNLANLLVETGQFQAARENFERALEVSPDTVETYGDLHFVLHYFAHEPMESSLAVARTFGRLVQHKAKRMTHRLRETTPSRLRIGIVSGDMRIHPVGYFLESLIAQLDQNRFELIAYPTYYKTDALSARIQAACSAWKPIYGKSDADAAAMIQADGVHILLDLSGHTAYNRLSLFAWKPAPVQASWLGYFASTGVAEIDYILADETGVPADRHGQFIEKVWYLPDTRLCFMQPSDEIPVAPLPALTAQAFTFGCFQAFAKINDTVLSAWSLILQALPQAKLRVTNKQFNQPGIQAHFQQRLRQCGIAPERVELCGSLPRAAYLAAHAEVDMMLDTFPYPGGTTTCEALWMGVPTLTLAGETLLARQGASLLTAAGLSDWVANSKNEYIAKAIQLTSDLPKLAALRAGLRQQVLASPLFDAPRFARNFEAALWGMWREKGLEILKSEPI